MRAADAANELVSRPVTYFALRRFDFPLLGAYDNKFPIRFALGIQKDPFLTRRILGKHQHILISPATAASEKIISFKKGHALGPRLIDQLPDIPDELLVSLSLSRFTSHEPPTCALEGNGPLVAVYLCVATGFCE